MRQPWLPESPPLKGADDFSAATATMPARRAALALALVMLLLAMGRSAQILDAAFGYEGPGSEMLLAVAEGWGSAMEALAIPQALEELASHLRISE
ncbi:hypothetical protein EOD42_13380 [Rhodovarius crocodyli]|uniref:Uncharacterized protein n=1 Tax=Rhodovarius crocodyli TaxID=1979269 RepID=A0A437MEN7_9PROT|nr:hypothetical protein [Rhodovarius crocodyli]RVT96108.1 hypothetical protein EOD42_13380 [Rhodovarius crocodyli]